jgi:hypothetical protein
MKNYFLLLFSVLLFSCQTEIEVTVPDYYNKLVVEGYIENGEYPVVSLFRSAPYFSTTTMSLNYLIDSVIIRDARVFVKPNSGDEQELFINSLMNFNPEYPLFLAYSTQNITGKINTSYSLRIEWNNNTYTAETKILEPFDLDSMGFVPTFGHTKIDSIANIRITMTDNGHGGNYYQFKVKIHSNIHGKDKGIPTDDLWITTIPAAFDDSPFKGQTFNYEIIRGTPPTLRMPPNMTEREQRLYFRMNYKIGDTVFLKYAKLDFNSFQFWNTAGGEIGFGQNPFMSPEPIISNIKCNTGEKCLGVWCGSAKKEIVMILD